MFKTDVYRVCVQTAAIVSQITSCFSSVKITHPATEMRFYWHFIGKYWHFLTLTNNWQGKLTKKTFSWTLRNALHFISLPSSHVTNPAWPKDTHLLGTEQHCSGVKGQITGFSPDCGTELPGYSFEPRAIVFSISYSVKQFPTHKRVH